MGKSRIENKRRNCIGKFFYVNQHFSLFAVFSIILMIFSATCLQQSEQQFLPLVERQTGNMREIYTVDTDGSKLTKRIQFPAGNLYWISPNGKHVAVFTRSQKGISDLPARTLIVVEISSGDIVGSIEQVGNTLSEHLSHYEEVVWSPNSEKLVFIRDSVGGQGTDLWLYVLETGLIHSLTADEGLEWSPAWSRDGEQLAFAALEPCGQSIWNCPPNKQLWNIVAMNGDGSNRRIIANFHDNQLLPSNEQWVRG